MVNLSNSIPKIIYAGQGGNAKWVATKLSEALGIANIHHTLLACNSLNTMTLSQERQVVFVISTQGEGEPPDNARALFSYLQSKKNYSLSQLKFSVFSLGDKSYPLFAKAGNDAAELLLSRGAKQIEPTTQADTDYIKIVPEWIARQCSFLSDGVLSAASSYTIPNLHREIRSVALPILEVHDLCDYQSSKKVIHVALDNTEAQLAYQPGDSLLIDIHTPFHLLENIASYFSDSTTELTNTLHSKEIMRTHGTAINQYQKINGYSLSQFSEKQLDNIDWMRILTTYPPRNMSFKQFIELLPNKSERLYSISSSPNYHVGEIHLTIRQFTRGTLYGRGLGSSYYSEYQDACSVTIKPNESFRLPEDETVPLILISAGTGLAPFRGFIFELIARQKNNKVWLFFGEQTRHTNFLYQKDLLEWLDTRPGDKLSVSFSRDVIAQGYIDSQIINNGKEILSWIEQGAKLFLCGSKSTLAVSVEQSIKKIYQQHKSLSTEMAEEAYNLLLTNGVLVRDVY
ncbi:MAG: sulfite reductase flavoprotein subunit alpha [Methylacidiphilales bacterium]|nr:sulfite reductase flavoprotein subunit alpha [Candidatus Methylacidiphilales bacterium]